MKAVLAANFKAHAGFQREKIVPALEAVIDLVSIIEAKDQTNFGAALDRTKPDVVLLLNELCSHQTSWRLADACRPRGIRLAVLGRQKSTWVDVIARLNAGAARASFGEHLRRERMAKAVSHFEVAAKCGGVAREVVKQSATFGEALAQERLREGMTQDELAELLDVSSQAISAWETATNVPVRAHYAALLDLFPQLVLAPEPPVQDIDKPNGGEGVERASVSSPEPAEPPMSSRMPNPVLHHTYDHDRIRKAEEAVEGVKRAKVALEAENESLTRQVQKLSGELAELRRRLEASENDSVTGAAEALRRLVRAGFLTEAEAAEKWTARIR